MEEQELTTQTKTKTGLRVSVVVLTVAAVAVVALAAGLFWSSMASDQVTVNIAGQEVKVAVANSPNEISQGLSEQVALKVDEGMLFVYDGYYIPSFWMKDMNFAIDIVWIKDGVVVGFEKNVSPSNNPELDIRRPTDFVNMVLEVNAGFADQYGVKIGDSAEINL